MPRTLANPDSINGTVTDEEITSFTVNVKSTGIYIVFDRKDNNDNVLIADAAHSLGAVESVAAITRASEIAGADVYSAIKQALYEFLPGNASIS